jgi:hypothetical protein
MTIMAVNHNLAQRPAAQAREEEFLTVNMVMPAGGDSAKETVGFARLLFGLAALALERFGAAPENHYPDALRELGPASGPGTPLDPFDGQPLRYRNEDGGYVLHSIGPDITPPRP